MIKIIHDGKTFVFKGEYRVPRPEEYFLAKGGTVMNGEILGGGKNLIVHEVRAILHPEKEEKSEPEKQIIISQDGLDFYSTGEIRVPGFSEYYLDLPLMKIASVRERRASFNKNFVQPLPCLIFHLLPKPQSKNNLKYGGIQFVKTGEYRIPMPGDWYLSEKTHGPVYKWKESKTHYEVFILKPAKIV